MNVHLAHLDNTASKQLSGVGRFQDEIHNATVLIQVLVLPRNELYTLLNIRKQLIFKMLAVTKQGWKNAWHQLDFPSHRTSFVFVYNFPLQEQQAKH